MDTDRQQPAAAGEPSRARRRQDGLSYKFQRLRERLRAAVTSGELAGKLPGERTLARRFHVNAKTLSKALTDLAAEGLLDRSIGRGTYVKGQSGNAESKPRGRWLILGDANRAASLVHLFQAGNPEAQVVGDVRSLRPSFLKQFDAVIDLADDTPEAFIRDLVVRNVPVVSVNREPGVYSVNMVGADRATGATLLARDLILAGHARLAVVESGSQGVVSRAVRQAAARYGQSTTEVRVCSAGDVLSTVQGDGATAVICDCAPAAREIRAILEAANVRPGHDVSLATVGCCDDDYPSSGQYVDNRLVAQTVAELLNGNGSAVGHRPTMIWLATRWVDQGTTRALPRGCEGEAA